ncbi:tyrosine-type recombinase/integrase [Desulfoluna spongiiphila]|nr:tyrosine-type recombinase/integrase [Desulfoluna spongiiphila]
MDRVRQEIDIEIDSPPTTVSTVHPIRLSEATQEYYDLKWKGLAHGEDSLIKLRVIIDALGDPPCNTITTTTVRRLRNILLSQNIGTATKKHHRADATVNRYVTALRTIILDQHKQGNLTKLPDWEMVSEKQYRRDRLVTDEELAAMIDFTQIPVLKYGQRGGETVVLTDKMTGAPLVNEEATQKRRLVGDLLMVLRKTGMRLGEACAITYGRHINLTRRTIMISADIAKGKSIRTLPMTPTVHTLLRDLSPAPDSRAFPLSNDYVGKVWKKGRRHLGITDKHFVVHAIRHTVATRLLEDGVPVAKVQALLGHEDISTTMIYTHLVPIDLADELERI